MVSPNYNGRTGSPSANERRSVVSYTRYSSDHQNERSIHDQQRRCRERAERDGLTIDREYADEAISGARHDRPDFNRLCNDCRDGKIAIVFVESLSRLSRDALLSQRTLLELMHRHGVRFVSLDDGVDTQNEGWELLAGIHGFQNEYYLKTLAKQVHRGLTGVVLEGHSVGDLRFGYSSEPLEGQLVRAPRNAKPKMRYVIVPEQAVWVRSIFHWYANEGWSLRRIAAELNRQGVPRDNRARSNRWASYTIVNLLRCTKYMGVWTWGLKKNNKDPLTGQIKQVERLESSPDVHRRDFPELAIVDAATFAAAQRRLDDSRNRNRGYRHHDGRFSGSPRSPKSSEARYLLSGLIECGECGRRMVAFGPRSEYFKCKNNIDGACGCSTHLRREMVERLVLGEISTRLFERPEAIDHLLATVLDEVSRVEATLNDIPRLQKELDALQGKINGLLDLAENGDPDATARIAQRQVEKREIADRLAALRSARPDVPDLPCRDWVETKVLALEKVLCGAAALANPLLASLLVGGKILVREIEHPGKKRKSLTGEFAINMAAPAAILLGLNSDHSPTEPSGVIHLDFRPLPPYEVKSDSVAGLVLAGVPFKEVAKRLNVSKGLVRRAWEHWHTKQGLATPDGRGAPFRQSGPSEAVLLRREEVVRRFFDGQLYAEIADAMGCNPCTVKQDLREWHAEQGLPMPDGRHRRKELDRKSRNVGGSSNDAA